MKEDSESKTNSSQEFEEVDEESNEDLSDDDEPKRSKNVKVLRKAAALVQQSADFNEGGLVGKPNAGKSTF